MLTFNFAFFSFVGLLSCVALGMPFFRSKLVSLFQGRPGGLAEITFWDHVLTQKKLQLEAPKQTSPFCAKKEIFASLRWFTAAQTAFYLPGQPKVLNLDPNSKSFYFFRDNLRDYMFCKGLLVAEKAHFAPESIAHVFKVIHQREFIDPDYLDRPIIIAEGEFVAQQISSHSDVELTPQKNLDARTFKNLFFGNLHAHTGWSDGKGAPEQAWSYARDQAKVDFFAITEHPEYWLFNSESTKWSELEKISRKFSTASFLALRGFEYSHPIDGHFVVLGSKEYCGFDRCGNLQKFYAWLEKTPDALVIFAHPGFMKSGRKHLEFNSFRGITDQLQKIFIGVEVLHWDGYAPFMDGIDGKLPYLDRALKNGWKIGSLASQDNHGRDWGNAGPNRIGVFAKSLNQEDFFAALRQRSFFATSADKSALKLTPLNPSEIDVALKIDARLEVEDVFLQFVSAQGILLQQSFSSSAEFSSVLRLKKHVPWIYARVFLKVKGGDIRFMQSGPIFLTE